MALKFGLNLSRWNMSELNCPFCTVDAKKILFENDLALAFFDAFPVSLGHTLIVPKRHVASFFELSKKEREAIDSLIFQVQDYLNFTFKPDGFNLGVNIGEAAGQSVMHVHVHVIPRFRGDMANPKGGVRGVIPDKQKY